MSPVAVPRNNGGDSMSPSNRRGQKRAEEAVTKASEKTVQAEQETKSRAFQNIEVSVPRA